MSRTLSYNVSGARVSEKQLKLLEPYLIGEEPRPNGEWDMHCPLHEDLKRSSSLNVKKGEWTCFSSCGGGSVSSLIKQKDEWVDPPVAGGYGGGGGGTSEVNPADIPTEARVAGWASGLLSAAGPLAAFKAERGLTTETLERFQIGWSTGENGHYTIPVRGFDGEFWNVRKYQLDPPEGRRKIWGITGMNSPRLFPVQILDENPEEIIICEGELDALFAIQEGFAAITRTGAAGVWNAQWNEKFRDKIVYLGHDADETGVAANNALKTRLRKVAREVHVITWPYPIVEKHGKDLTDYLREYDAEGLRGLLEAARGASQAAETPTDLDPADADVLETFDSKLVGRPLRFVSTVMGKSEPGYSIPKVAELRCTMDKGNKCNSCPLFGAGGLGRVEIKPSDPITLKLVEATDKQNIETLREKFGAVPCDRIEMDVAEYQAVEILYVRPSVDHVKGSQAADYKSRRVMSVGKHDTPSNTTVEITGALHPDPRRQRNEFVAWEVDEQETSLDNFQLSDDEHETLKIFQPAAKQTALAKAVNIARDLSSHVTRIIGRDEMHVFLDLIWHSVLSFDFDGERVDRGWVEGLIVGDTRTGKSLICQRLIEHYGVGEMIDCGSASFAGLVGGLQQHGGSSEFTVNWGVIPINNGRLVVLDEVGDLPTDDIARMSSVRSSGEAQLNKIQSGRAAARTRLAWLANPREARLADFTYGVDAIRPLIGNAEDIARFTMAMAAKFDPELGSRINTRRGGGELRYSSEACSRLVLWCWSRKPEHIQFTSAAVNQIYKSANELGGRYVENPPLIQVANVRVKLASLAAALAARTFSTDATHENLIIKASHVRDIVKFLDRIYSYDGFGYKDRSDEALGDMKHARKNVDNARKYLRSHKGLAKFLRGSGRFKRQDIEEIMNYSRESANGVITKLHEFRMVSKQGGFVVVAPVLHDLLRDKEIE